MSVVFLGAGGRLGRLIRPRWRGAARWLDRSDVDVTDAATLADALAGATAVFCLAGVTPGSNRAMEGNVGLAQSTLDAAAVAGAGRVFLFSTAAVYGGLPATLLETGPVAPVSPYGHAKLAMEQMAAHHAHPNTVLRLGNVAGADAILGGWRTGFRLDQVPGGGTPLRSYIGPGVLARVLGDLAAARDLPTILNVAAPGAVAMGALLDAAGLGWAPQPATEKTLANVTLDTTRLIRLTAFQPADSTAAGIVADWQEGFDV